MAIRVQHSPSAAAVGGVARQAGLGQYSKFMQQMIEQRNARAQQERMQRTTIEAQRQRDLQYQQFQRDMDQVNFGQSIAMSELAQDQRQELADSNYSRNAWQGYVGQIKDWQHWTPQQKQEFQRIQSDLQKVMQDQGLRPEEKAEAVRQGITRLQGVQAMVVPRAKSPADKWAAEGKGVGDTWIENGGKYTRDANGNVKNLVKPITLDEIEKISKQAMENTMEQDKFGNPVKASLAVREIEETRLLDKWYKLRGMEEMMSTYGQEFQAGDETYVDQSMIQQQPQPGSEPTQSDYEQMMEGVGWKRNMVESEVRGQYPMAFDALGLTAEMAERLPDTVAKALPTIEREIEYVSKINNPQRARELRRMLQKIQAIMQAQGK